MEINHKIVQLLNGRSSDLDVEIKFLEQLQFVNAEEVPSVTATISELQTKLKNQLNVEGDENLIPILKHASQKATWKMKVYLGFDVNAKTLAEIGATKAVLTGLNKVKDKLQEEIFGIYNIKDEDLKENENDVK